MIRSSKHNDSVRRMGPAVAMVAAAIVLALCLPYRASAQGGFSGPGQYEITNTRSGMVLEIDRNDQSSVMQSASRGTNSQVWEVRDADSGFYYLQNIVNGYALESVGTGNGARAIATRFNGRANQQWRFDTSRNGDALIISRLGNMLDIQGMTGSERARVYQGNGSSGQQFRFRQLSPNFNDSWSVNRDGNYNDNNRSGENRLTIERNNNISWETQEIGRAHV